MIISTNYCCIALGTLDKCLAPEFLLYIERVGLWPLKIAEVFGFIQHHQRQVSTQGPAAFQFYGFWLELAIHQLPASQRHWQGHRELLRECDGLHSFVTSWLSVTCSQWPGSGAFTELQCARHSETNMIVLVLILSSFMYLGIDRIVPGSQKSYCQLNQLDSSQMALNYIDLNL